MLMVDVRRNKAFPLSCNNCFGCLTSCTNKVYRDICVFINKGVTQCFKDSRKYKDCPAVEVEIAEKEGAE